MTIDELQIQLDISLGNELEVLKQQAHETSIGCYVFIDSNDGQCYLFDKHRKLDDISKIKYIGYCAFYNCQSLKIITIPDSVKNIGNYAFDSCTSLKSIIIPNSVESIGKWAFYNCTSLIEVIFNGKTIDQVEAMCPNSWGIKDTSIIKCQMS